eukprot:341375_1
MAYFVNWIIMLLAYFQISFSVAQCQNEEGHAVDWWFARRTKDTTRFVYFDSLMEAAHHRRRLVQFKRFNFATARNPLLRLLDPIHNEANNRHLEVGGADAPAAQVGYIAYNEQSVSGPAPTPSYAHAKGFISWNLAGQPHPFTGQWLIHSQPGW